MKIMKFIFICVGIVIGVGGAFATNTIKAPCEFMTQYRFVNGSYVLAGEYAVDYYCVGTFGVCTWYKPWPTSDWTPCKTGTYHPLDE